MSMKNNQSNDKKKKKTEDETENNLQNDLKNIELYIHFRKSEVKAGAFSGKQSCNTGLFRYREIDAQLHSVLRYINDLHQNRRMTICATIGHRALPGPPVVSVVLFMASQDR